MSVSRKVVISFLQAAGLAVYCGAVATLMLNLGPVFSEARGALGAIFLLVLFVVSAVLSAAIVLGHPTYLALSGRIREGVHIVAATVGWLLVVLLILGALVVLAV